MDELVCLILTIEMLRSIGWFNNETEEDLLQQFILREESYREQKNRSLSDRGIKRSAAAADLTTEEYNEHVYIPDSTARSLPNPRLLEVRRQNLSADTTLDDITDGEADEDDDEHEHSGRLKEVGNYFGARRLLSTMPWLMVVCRVQD
jgi:hypothetical protein